MIIKDLTMDRIRHILLGEVVGLLLIVLVIIILFETNFVLPGEISGMEWSNDLVVTQFVMQIITLAVIPFALYMFKMAFVRKQLATSTEKATKALIVWGTVRIGLICIPIIFNALYYYIFGFEVSFFYLALILLLSIVFIFPTKRRCENECCITEEN